MPEGEVQATTGAFGLVTDDGVEWTPLGKVREAPLTSPYDSAVETLGLIGIEPTPITVNWIEWQFIRRYLGLPRLSYVWEYRRWNKGHAR